MRTATVPRWWPTTTGLVRSARIIWAGVLAEGSTGDRRAAVYPGSAGETRSHPLISTLMRPVSFNRDKFRELILYIAEQTEDDPSFGDTLLNKVLYWSDFRGYSELGQPV